MHMYNHSCKRFGVCLLDFLVFDIPKINVNVNKC